MAADDTSVARRRKAMYGMLGLGLVVAPLTLHGVEWQGSAHLHTVMEALSTQLALGVGILALVRYYSKKDNTLLLIGVGFLGTAFLDGFHAVVTSEMFRPLMPSDLPSLIPWSWVASRIFLSVAIFLSWAAWRQEIKRGDRWRLNTRTVYLFATLFTLGSFGFFAFAPLPPAYYPELFFHRPEEFAPAFFFGLALIGYLRKGRWREDSFEHWLVLSLIVGFVSQAVFMSHSGVLFDYEFDLAHLLKKVSYICVMVGLLISVHATFRQVDGLGQRWSSVVDNAVDGIITIDVGGVIETVNPAVSKIFEYSPDQLIGKNIAMLLPHEERGDHQKYLDNSDLHAARVINQSRDLEGRRKDGSIFPIDLTVTRMSYDGQTKFAGIVRDITERKRTERLKNEFVSTVSHELRTPLTSIKGALGLIEAGTVGELPPELKSMVDIAYKNSERLVRLINDILDIEKIEAGKMDFRMEAHNLSALISSAIDANTAFADQYEVELELTEVVPQDRIYGDADRLQQVFANLFSNAVKFSPKGSRVEISVSRISAGFKVAVRDRGHGIDDEFREQVFEKFSQVDATDSRQKGGTGLGLNIARSIVETHGGKLYFEDNPGGGTVFMVELPAWREQAQQPKAVGKNQAGPKILVCEDDPDIAALISFMLRTGGYQPVVSKNAEQVKTLLAEQKFQAMTLDIKLPGQDGISLFRELRSNPETRDLPIIIISATPSDEAEQLNGDAIGLVDWLVKPIDRDRLLRSLELTKQVATGSLNVLHIEDDPDLCRVVSTLLKGIAKVTSVHRLADAMVALEESQFDLVILDLNLPDGVGEDILPLLRRKDQTSIPVVVFSAEEVSDVLLERVAAALVKSKSTNENLLQTVRSTIHAYSNNQLDVDA